MTKPLDKTLEAFQNVEDAIADIKTQKNVMKNEIMIADYDKILVYLEKASENLDQCDCDISEIREVVVKASIVPK